MPEFSQAATALSCHGEVRHLRTEPRRHAFRYRVWMLWVDLAELSRMPLRHRLFRPGGGELLTTEAVREELARAGTAGGRLRTFLLTQPASFGYAFNPVNLYFCIREGGLVAVLLQVTNTPWEAHARVRAPAQGAGGKGAMKMPDHLVAPESLTARTCRTMVERALQGIEDGTIVLATPSGTSTFGAGAPNTCLYVHDPACFRRLVFGGSVGAGESYMAGQWDCDELVELVRIMLRNRRALSTLDGLLALPAAAFTSVRHLARRNSRPGARRNIRAHYDLAHEFFQLFLDARLTLSLERRFHRVVSVEMFEHVRNYGALLRRIAGWLEPGGRLFVHVFCHRHLMYPFETEGAGNWMGRHFFTGGLMPAKDTLLNFQDHVTCRNQWEVSGEHYRRTARAWLDSLDGNRDAAAAVLADRGGRRAVQRWRMFFMACEELFGWRGGREWMVCHYLFDRVGPPPS